MPQHANHREREILEELRLSGGSSRIQFLADRLSVSEETIRRNLKTMEESGLVIKVHGGVHLKGHSSEQPLHFRMSENAEAKRLIAAKVASMIGNGDTLFLDVGSTTAFIAVALQKHQNLFVVTNSLSVANALATRNNNRVFLAGGALRPHDGGAFGVEAADFVKRFNVEHAIFSVTAIDARHGFMLQDMEEAEFSRVAARQAANRIVVADAGKFGLSAPIIIDDPRMYSHIVTNAPPPADIAGMLSAHEIELVVAGNKEAPQSSS